ncbi:MAG: heparan-alpha-glucosaminide N-acetyltransferase domain-containing protein [Eubacterium sp.]|nr:heparan-alpha-glucosaminide N-acetyltransferase domain-containing protein [Eubacterium sp.]
MDRKLFSKEVVNKGRQKEFDWAKAFTIMVMLTIHTYEELSVVDINQRPTGIFRNVLEFLAGPLGAPLFMFSMGIGMMYSRNTEPGKMCFRGVKLMRNGYLLSFFKGTVFVIIGTLLGEETPISISDSLFLVSILQFAGMAFFAIALMKKLKLPLPGMLAVSLILSVAGTCLNTYDMTGWKQYLLGLFFMTNEVTSFPLFLWLYYPVAGMIFAYFLLRVNDKKRFYTMLFIFSVIGIILTSVIYYLCGIDLKSMYMLMNRTFYTQSVWHYIFTTFVILAGMSVYYALSELITAEPVVRFVSFLGKNLDVVYIVQWLVVSYIEVIIVATNSPKLSLYMVVPVGLILLVVSMCITNIYLKVRAKRQAKKKN